jgi:hypothetical protein
VSCSGNGTCLSGPEGAKCECRQGFVSKNLECIEEKWTISSQGSVSEAEFIDGEKQRSTKVKFLDGLVTVSQSSGGQQLLKYYLHAEVNEPGLVSVRTWPCRLLDSDDRLISYGIIANVHQGSCAAGNEIVACASPGSQIVLYGQLSGSGTSEITTQQVKKVSCKLEIKPVAGRKLDMPIMIHESSVSSSSGAAVEAAGKIENQSPFRCWHPWINVYALDDADAITGSTTTWLKWPALEPGDKRTFTAGQRPGSPAKKFLAFWRCYRAQNVGHWPQGTLLP